MIGKLRTNGRGEYTSSEFKDFFLSSGINYEVTAPYTPQHNDTSKRKKITIVTVMRSMSKQKEVHHCLRGEAAATATHLINWCPTKKFQDKTLEEACSGVKPNVQNLIKFCSLYSKHILDQIRRK